MSYFFNHSFLKELIKALAQLVSMRHGRVLVVPSRSSDFHVLTLERLKYDVVHLGIFYLIKYFWLFIISMDSVKMSLDFQVLLSLAFTIAVAKFLQHSY